MTRRSIGAASVLFGASLWGGAAHGAVLTQYNFNSSAAPLAADPAFTASGVTAGAISPNTGTTASNAGFVRSTNNPAEGVGSLAITFANLDDTTLPASGAASTDNITFIITATSGVLDLDSLTFLTNTNGDIPAGNGGAIYGVQYDDLADGAGYQELTMTPSARQTTFASVARSVDLSGTAFNNLTSGIRFRINFIESRDAGIGPDTNNSTRVDAITVNGVVPEPASAALLGVGAVGLLMRRRHRA